MAIQELTMEIQVTSEEASTSPWWLLQGTARGISSWLKLHNISSSQVREIKYFKMGDDGTTPIFSAQVKHAA